jgi:hypothetical protein
MPPMPIRPPPWCRIFSDRYVSRATLTLRLDPDSFDPPHIKAYKHCFLHRAEVEASTPCVCFSCFAPFTPTKISHVVGRNRHPLM